MLLANVIIAGGMNEQNKARNRVEIIDLVNPKLKHTWVDERAARCLPFGGILQNKPLLFGGCDINYKNLKDGISFGSSVEIYEYEIEDRRCASSVVLNQTRLWVTGGVDEIWEHKKSSQFLSLNQSPEKGPELPFTVNLHCMVQVDSETIYLIGGVLNRKASNKTWIINPTKNFEMREGPNMNHSRTVHSCATMKLNNKVFIVAVGGYNPSGTRTTVEILDTSLPANNWKFGM